jgi:hypothetical protein
MYVFLGNLNVGVLECVFGGESLTVGSLAIASHDKLINSGTTGERGGAGKSSM